MAKVGDTVRYLNSVGGGKIVRIEGNIAYVDEDGFETPVLLRECVVVGTGYYGDDKPAAKPEPSAASAGNTARTATPAESGPNTAHAAASQQSDSEPELHQLPFIETQAGEKLNVVLAFEALNPKSLSSSTYEASLVNDSNYWLAFAYMSRRADDEKWTLHRADSIEPGTQLILEEFTRDDIPSLERICIQFFAYKREKQYDIKQPQNVEFKLDVTKFFKLHCFVPNPYFDRPVIALDIVKDDQPMVKNDLSTIIAAIDNTPPSKDRAAGNPRRPVKKKADKDKPIEVDLHIHELVDTTAGLSPADMLNLQVDTFRRVMDENIKYKGKRIVFIHGKGDGVLRKAILKELGYRYKNCRWQDASFREYGFGATQVEIH